MELNTLWFILVAVLYTGYFILEGFDFGVGILLPFLGKDDIKRRVIINTIGPHWDGNEVWLITAGGATFAAFPHWYATLFSGFYLPLFLILLALIVRGVAFEFRSKHGDLRWRKLWDNCIFIGSLIPAILWGVAFANFIRGVPLDSAMQYTGGFWNLLNGYSLLGGLVSVLLFTLHGAIFLTLKTEGDIPDMAYQVSRKLWLPVWIAFAGFTIASYSATDFMNNGWNLGIAIGFLALVLAMGWLIRIHKTGWAFVLTTSSVLLFTVFFFTGLYPRVLIASTNPSWSLTIENASSSPYTLQVMSIVALIFVPIVLLYQGWSYWVFRKRISEKSKHLEY